MSTRFWGLVGTLRDSVYGLWTLDETGGTRYSTAGAAPDLAEDGGSVSVVAGRFSRAITNTEINPGPALEATLSPALGISAGLTVSFWFNMPAWTTANPKTLLSLRNAGAEPYLIVSRYYNSDFLDLGFRFGAEYLVLPLPRLGNFTEGDWHLLVVRYNATTGKLEGMVDDGCFASATDWTVAPLPAEKLSATAAPADLAALNAITFDALTVGKAFDGNHVNGGCAIDDLRIWERALTNAEVERLYLGAEVTLTQRYQQIVQEDLNVGTEAVWITAPGGGELRATQMGLHSVARGQVAYEATWAPGSIAAGSKASTTVTVPDATVGDFVLSAHDKMLTGALNITGHVSAADTAKVVIHNPTSAAITVASGTVRVLVFPSISASAVLTSTVNGTVTYDGPTFPWENINVVMTVDAVPWPGGDAITDAAGYYEFLLVPAGAINVSVSGNPPLSGPQTGSNTGNTAPPATLTLDIEANAV